MKNPRQLPAGGSPSVSSLSGSEVTLSANVQEDRALVLELVDRCRLRGAGAVAKGHASRVAVEGDILKEETSVHMHKVKSAASPAMNRAKDAI
jgi:hypothetical protein